MKSILLVEDDQFLIDIYHTKLKEAGFEVEVTSGGEECLRKLREKVPDLMILDIVLPKLDGWEILREIRSDEKLKDLKVVVISNLSHKSEIEKGKRMGVLKYMIKAHYTPSEIVSQIKEILK